MLRLYFRASGRVPLLARRLCSVTGEEDGQEQVGARLERNVLRAGLRALKGDVSVLKKNAEERGLALDVDKLVELRQQYSDLSNRIEKLRQERNVNIKQFATITHKEDQEEHARRGAEFRRAIAELEDQREVMERVMYPQLALIPNTSHPQVPIGGYESAKLVHTHGTKPEFTFRVRDHVEIGESLGLFDFSSAAQVTGNSFYYLKREAALLELALVQFAVNKAVVKGYSPVITPDIVRTDVVEGCGFHPRGESTQVYGVSPKHGNLSLSGTAEIPLAGMFSGKSLSKEQLPIRLAAFGRCYRAESGGYGQAVRGLFRVHQFSKVELFAVTAGGGEGEGEGEEEEEGGAESEKMLEEMVGIQEEICSDLGLHYRLLEMPTEELGHPVHRKYDIEAWMPGRGEYGEVTSASNCTSFQSQRLGISLKGKTHRTYPHTLNATACAIPRTIIALLETHQQEDGSVALPPALFPFLPPHCHHIRPSA